MVAAECEEELVRLVGEPAPALLDQPGIGLICAAQVICAWSHHGRLRSEAAFAALAGVAPIPASSGQAIRHRLNRGGDRQLNRALHTIVVWRMNFHPESKAHWLRRRAEGKSDREIRSCLNVTLRDGSSACLRVLTRYRSIPARIANTDERMTS